MKRTATEKELRYMVEIVFIKSHIHAFEIKLAESLKQKGYKVSCISLYELNKEQKKSFNESYYLLERELTIKKFGKFNRIYKFFIVLRKILKFLFQLRKFDRCIAIAIGGFNWFLTLCFLLMKKKIQSKIYFPYDIAFFRYKNYKKYPWFERICEKYNFQNCDAILHKGPKDELKYLPKEFQATRKPALQFLPYCDEKSFVPIDDDFFERKLSKEDGRIHLVYAGGVYHKCKPHFDTIEIFRKIVEQGFILHVYATNFETLKEEEEYKKLEETGLFYLHEPIYDERLQREISKYDWGIYIFFTNFEEFKRIWAKTAYGNKVSTYLEAGLPVICNRELEFVSKVVESNGFGVVVEKPSDIKHEIEKMDYKKLVLGLKERRKNFTIEKNIEKLMTFLEDSGKSK